MNTALLLIDPLNDFIAEGGKLWPYAREVATRVNLLANMRALVDSARAAGMPVVFVPHHRFDASDMDGWQWLNPTHAAVKNIKPFVRGTWGAEFHDDFRPQSQDLIAHEHWLHNGFSATDLDYLLRMHGVNRIILAGMRANTCVEASARHAVELGYHVTIASDATAAFRLQEWQATIEINAPLFAHAVMRTEEITSQIDGGLLHTQTTPRASRPSPPPPQADCA